MVLDQPLATAVLVLSFLAEGNLSFIVLNRDTLECDHVVVIMLWDIGHQWRLAQSKLGYKFGPICNDLPCQYKWRPAHHISMFKSYT